MGTAYSSADTLWTMPRATVRGGLLLGDGLSDTEPRAAADADAPSVTGVAAGDPVIGAPTAHG